MKSKSKNLMSHHFSMGAINKRTLQYENPKIACKTNKYKCPSCNQDVIFRKGKKKKPHYAHKKSENPCYYYERPSESQIHKDAKMLMKMLLDKKTNMTFCRKCCYCEYPEDIGDITYTDNTKAVIEYRFHYNNSNRSADVALVDKYGNIVYIFEICYTNKTKEENRPEPWFEIDAESFIEYINESNEKNETKYIICKRDNKCARCISKEREAKLLVRELFREQRRIEKEAKLLVQEQIRTKKEAKLLVQEQIRTKKEENLKEKTEQHKMGVEDVRTILSELALENERIERELEQKETDRRYMEEYEEYHKERQRLIKEERDEKQRILQRLSDQNQICSICKINHCKCDTPNFETDKYKRTACTHCRKQKCKCVIITKFLKKNTL